MLFAEHIYGSRNLREKCDLDLLVKPEFFLQALDLLIRQGFQQEYFGHAQVSTKQTQLIKREEQISVDLHYALTPQYQLTHMDEATSGSHLQPEQWNRRVDNRTYWFFQLDLEPVWARSRVLRSGDSEFRVLSDEDAFLVAFIHGFKENWRYFIRFCDLAEIIVKKPGLDWVFLLQEAHRLRASRKLALALRLLVDHLGVRLPQDVLRFTRRNSSACLAREIVLRRLASQPQESPQEFRRVVSVLTMDSM